MIVLLYGVTYTTSVDCEVTSVAIAVAEVVVAAPRRSPESLQMGEGLEVIRRERGLTQQEVAERLGMSLQGYLNYRKGYGRVNRDTLPRWASALDTPIPELARRLGIELLVESDASGLRQELAAILPDADAAELDDLTRRLST